jgi:microcin C transport system permease protein
VSVSPDKPLSVFQRRWKKFKTMKRGWYSFQFLLWSFLLSFFLPLFVGSRAIVAEYEGELVFPVLADLQIPFRESLFPVSSGFLDARDFGFDQRGLVDWREFQEREHLSGSDNWALLPPYPFGRFESLLGGPTLREGRAPHPPNHYHWCGTDDRGRDVFARLVYGYRTSLLFGLTVVAFSYLTGTFMGALFGYFGGIFDIIGQRLVEIWSSLPFLYTVIIVAALLRPNLWLLVVILTLFSWVGISYYIRGEFLREKSKDYVAASIAVGEGNLSIMFRHILPNALTPIISFAPFALVGAISSLVGLDFLGFGLPAPTPSWGELVNQGLSNIYEWHLVAFPLSAMFLTLLLVVFVGEAVREAFDPKPFSRLR